MWKKKKKNKRNYVTPPRENYFKKEIFSLSHPSKCLSRAPLINFFSMWFFFFSNRIQMRWMVKWDNIRRRKRKVQKKVNKKLQKKVTEKFSEFININWNFQVQLSLWKCQNSRDFPSFHFYEIHVIELATIISTSLNKLIIKE